MDLLWLGLGGFVALLLVCYAISLAIATGWRVGRTPRIDPRTEQRLRDLEAEVTRLALAHENVEAGLPV
jgi:hypothetical protein